MGMISILIKVFSLTARLGLIGACGSVGMAHADDSLDGHRLFFTDDQRKQATHENSHVSPDRLSGSSAQVELKNATHQRGASIGERAKIDSPETRQRSVPMVQREGGRINYEVYFTGLITGKREPRILVNGLPCEPVSTEVSGKSDHPLSIDCHGMSNDELRLAVSIASGELLVTDRGGRVHHLLPGEGM